MSKFKIGDRVIILRWGNEPAEIHGTVARAVDDKKYPNRDWDVEVVKDFFYVCSSDIMVHESPLVELSRVEGE